MFVSLSLLFSSEFIASVYYSGNKEVSSSSTNLSDLTPQQKNEKQMKCSK